MASSPESDPAPTIERPYRVEIDAGGEGAVVTTVVEAIAAIRGVGPIDLDVRLDEFVDADAVECLYRHARGKSESSWTLQFDVDEFVVTVRSDGRVTIA